MNLKTKQKLKKNELTFGSWITLGHPSIGEIMAGIGFDWLTIDMEHSVISLSDAQSLIQVIGLKGVCPLVRVGQNDAYLIKRVMDAGAHGVIVPMVNSREDALNAVKAVKYPPLGTRGVGLARAQGYGLEFESYKSWLEEESIVIAQIEHIEAINHLEEILEVPGIDGTIIGPYDLSGSLGHPGKFERSEVKEALLHYEKICSRRGKTMGYHVVQLDPEQVDYYRKKCYSFIAVGLDTLYLSSKCQEIMESIRKHNES